MDPSNRPEPFKRYPGIDPTPLPTDLRLDGAAALNVLAGRAQGDEGGEHPIDLQFLARLLFLAAGVTRISRHGSRPTYFRAAPSAGNLHPLETYLVTGGLPGLETGVNHFAPDIFGLEQLRTGDHRGVVADAAAEPNLRQCSALLVLSAIPWRTAWKYGERGWRHVYWDAGTMLANLLAVAESAAVRARLLFGFRDADLCRLIGVDGRTEFPIVVVALEAAVPGGRDGPQAAERRPAKLTELSPETTELSRAPVELPLITAAQQAGRLETADQVAAWRDAAQTGLQHRTGKESTAVPPEVPATGPLDSVILARGSTRVMRHGIPPPEALSWALGAANRPVPADVLPLGRPLLSHELSVHALAGLEPGRYRWDDGQLSLRRATSEAEARAVAAHLCLDQALGGDSAYTLFTCADLDEILRLLGDRGYRVAQTAAGVAVGRVQLAAFALGYGATGLTFYDDEVSAAFSTTEACLMVCSVGEPAYTSVPGGRPGQPAELALM